MFDLIGEKGNGLVLRPIAARHGRGSLEKHLLPTTWEDLTSVERRKLPDTDTVRIPSQRFT